VASAEQVEADTGTVAGLQAPEPTSGEAKPAVPKAAPPMAKVASTMEEAANTSNQSIWFGLSAVVMLLAGALASVERKLRR
jgi:hypothetical protein